VFVGDEDQGRDFRALMFFCTVFTAVVNCGEVLYSSDKRGNPSD
jgi:hypothetical protein